MFISFTPFISYLHNEANLYNTENLQRCVWSCIRNRRLAAWICLLPCSVFAAYNGAHITLCWLQKHGRWSRCGRRGADTCCAASHSLRIEPATARRPVSSAEEPGLGVCQLPASSRMRRWHRMARMQWIWRYSILLPYTMRHIAFGTDPDIIWKCIHGDTSLSHSNGVPLSWLPRRKTHQYHDRSRGGGVYVTNML